MKKVLLGALLVTLFVSCSKSPEEKANAMIEDDVKKVLYHPETYDPVETQVDSAFTPFDDSAFYGKTVQLCKLGMSIDECDRNMKLAKSSMSIWSGPYQSAFDRNEYQEAKDKYDENAQNKKSAEIKAKKLANELKGWIEKKNKDPNKYASLTRYLIFFAVFFDAKMEYMQHKKSMWAIRKVLKKYGTNPLGKKVFSELSDRKRKLQLDERMWKIMIRTFSWGMELQWYMLLAAGIKILVAQRVDERLSDTGMRE